MSCWHFLYKSFISPANINGLFLVRLLKSQGKACALNKTLVFMHEKFLTLHTCSRCFLDTASDFFIYDFFFFSQLHVFDHCIGHQYWSGFQQFHARESGLLHAAPCCCSLFMHAQPRMQYAPPLYSLAPTRNRSSLDNGASLCLLGAPETLFIGAPETWFYKGQWWEHQMPIVIIQENIS